MLLRIARGAAGLTLFLAATIGVQLALGHRVPASVLIVVLLAANFGAYVGQAYAIERRTPRELSPSAWRWLPAGFLFGVALFAVVLSILAALGIYRPGSFISLRPLAVGLAVAFVGAVFEELIFRGFIFRWTQSTVGTWAGIAFSGLLFGAFHHYNPGATAFSSLAIAVEAGVLLSAAYVFSGNLWLPIGLHTGWNFAEGTLFGLAVSGSTPRGIVHGTLSGPLWLTGGRFGVEATPLAVAVCLCAGLALLAAAVRAKRIVPPAWSHPRSLSVAN